MKTFSNRFFLFFILLTGSILAVLGMVLGQLFPFYLEKYLELGGFHLSKNEIDYYNTQFIIALSFY